MPRLLLLTDDRFVDAREGSSVYARHAATHLLDDAFALPGHSRVVSWSGTLADAPFASDPRNWMKPGQDALDTALDHWAGELERAGTTLLLRPHARHLLNDAPGILRLLRSRAGQPFGLALDPAALLEVSMLDRTGEHLARLFETLGELADLILLRDAAVSDDGADLRPCPPGEGVLPGDVLRELLRQVPSDLPLACDDPAAFPWAGVHAAPAS